MWLLVDKNGAGISAVRWNTEDAMKQRTWGFAADFCVVFDLASLNHFFFSFFLTRGATVLCSLSEQIFQAWVMMPTNEMRIFVIWRRRRHLSFRFLLPFIISHVAGWNVWLLGKSSNDATQRRKKCCICTVALYLKQHIYINVFRVNVWMRHDLSKVMHLSWLPPFPKESDCVTVLGRDLNLLIVFQLDFSSDVCLLEACRAAKLDVSSSGFGSRSALTLIRLLPETDLVLLSSTALRSQKPSRWTFPLHEIPAKNREPINRISKLKTLDVP